MWTCVTGSVSLLSLLFCCLCTRVLLLEKKGCWERNILLKDVWLPVTCYAHRYPVAMWPEVFPVQNFLQRSTELWFPVDGDIDLSHYCPSFGRHCLPSVVFIVAIIMIENIRPISFCGEHFNNVNKSFVCRMKEIDIMIIQQRT